MAEAADALSDFVTWCAAHICGDEKGEAQLFLNQLFRACGHAGLKEAGATCEERIKKDGGGTAFADLVWKPVVLIEMKKRGADLSKHYRQAFDYWTRLVPGRPRYVVLCNFDEFWVYDFETQMDTPVDRVTLADLPHRHGPLAFLFQKPRTPVFGNDQEKVTRQAADLLAELFNALVTRGIPRDTAQRFTLQSLMCLFAEDIGLLEKYFFARLLDDCDTPAKRYDLIGGLFSEMNTPGKTAGGRFKGVDYFNGGLFAQPARLELTDDELDLLKNAARFDWSLVRPEIFGTIFEHSLGAEQRHAYGAHFTSPADIMKIIGPTIVEPWREQIEGAKTLKRLEELLARLENFRVLDPACGSGNFLYIAYRELKRLEARIYERIGEFASRNAAQRPFGFVTARNFFGMDIQPFAVELAKVTMMLAHKLAIDELHVTENALPLDNLDANFLIGDALIAPDGRRAPWPHADVIIGNPPFLGAKRLKPEHGADYVNAVRRLYPEVPGMADYCVYWFRRAHDHLPTCAAADPVAGRAGLVGTQNIRNNASRVGGLDAICADGTVIEAVDNQPWSGEANVHVSIANWAKTQNAALLPKTRRLWFKAAQRGAKDFDLDCREVARINSALADGAEVGAAAALACNTKPQRCFNGQMLGHQGFLLTPAQRAAIVARDPRSAEIIHPYLNGVDALTGATLDRHVLDFEQRDALQAAAYSGAYEWVKANILPDRERKAEEGKSADGKMRSHHKAFLARWWQLSFGRPEMLSVIKPLPRYLCCAYVTKRPIFIFAASSIRPSNLIQVFAFADDYSFGLLQSAPHWQWFVAKCGKLKSDFRYSAESVFDTFPWPQAPSVAQINAIAAAGREIRRIRAEALETVSGGLRVLYRTLDLPGRNPLRDAHAALDRAVLAAYGFSAKADLLQQLLDLNRIVAARIAAGETVTPPGVPARHPAPARLLTDDCLGAPA
ncbi:MAG: DNA modification methyltransferase-like protein [bacterium]|nr:MAG: DNA modification methyltransferase-like protein [bacterium]KAF0150575.1 MAG: DNA modification methyltransferase-like protein [bacterium]KAF0164608.1 MAG: DNA modification methyltransferase-like protein [bacterium]TXT17387.1 MAG: DNA modification methyltransferase-like protein [bacterium]